MYDESTNLNAEKLNSLFKSLTPKYQEYALIQLSTLADFQNMED
jgi:hypothetical protein